MKVLPKYLVFVLLIIIFNCILIAIFNYYHQVHEKVVYEIKNANCDVDACIRVCCGNNLQCLLNDTFDNIHETKEAQNLSRNFHLIKEDLVCKEPGFTSFENNDPFVYLEVKEFLLLSSIINLVYFKNGAIQIFDDDDGTFQIYGTNQYCVSMSSLIALDSTCEMGENSDLVNRGNDMASICKDYSTIYCGFYPTFN